MIAPPPGPMTDRQLAGYVLHERIAVGGMAEIYRATRSGPGDFAKSVAIKMVLPDLNRDAQFVQMFLQEARLAAQLASPRLVQVFDFGERAGQHYLVMEHVDGVDLAELLSHCGPLPIAVGLHIGRQLCAALADLHEALGASGQPLGIVHRDISPGNVLLSLGGDVKLGDFGVAKARVGAVRTARGLVKGKLAYLSPEQARGDELDSRADLYGAGLVLFEVLTGQRYLSVDGEAELLRAAAAPVWRPPTELRPELPAGLDDVLARALAVEPTRRFASAQLLDRALGALLPDGDETATRRALAALVQRARAGEASRAGGRDKTEDVAKPRAAGAPRAHDPPKPGTELLRRPAASRGRTLALIAAGAMAAGGVIAGALVVWPTDPLNESRAPALLDRRDGGSTTAERATGAKPTDDAGARAPDARAPDMIASPPAGAAKRPIRPRRRRSAISVARTSDAGSPAPRSTDAKTARSNAARGARIAELDRLLSDKGIVAGDAPELFASRRALTDRTALAKIERVLARARAIAIDRTFIHRKLRRLDRKLAQAKLAPSVARLLQRRSRRALSHAVTGRYADANRELNAIARAVER